MKAYQAIIYAKPGTLLLGGVKMNRSTPFETIGMAEGWVYAAGQQPNYGRYEIRVVQSKRPITSKEAHGYRGNPASSREAEMKKVLGKLYDPLYIQEFKIPKYNGRVTVLNGPGAMILARSGKWSKEDHVRLSKLFTEKAESFSTAWGKVAEAAAQETWGRSYQFHDYRISGIASDEFTEEKKDKLRFYAQGAGVLKTLAYEHGKAASLQNRYKYKHNPAVREITMKSLPAMPYSFKPGIVEEIFVLGIAPKKIEKGWPVVWKIVDWSRFGRRATRKTFTQEEIDQFIQESIQRLEKRKLRSVKHIIFVGHDRNITVLK